MTTEDRIPRRAARARYLLLSLLTGVVELGAVLYTARVLGSLTLALVAGLAYQVAALFVQPLMLSARDYRRVVVLGLIAAGATTVAPAALFVAVPLVAIGLQGIRDEQLAHVTVPTLPKRAARIVGFVLSAGFTPVWLAGVALIVLTVGGFRTDAAGAARRCHPLAVDRFAVLMVVHQTHYFVYSYSLLFLLSVHFPDHPTLVAMAFAVGWVSYALSPVILSRLPTLPVLVAGHLLVSVALGAIAAYPESRPLVLVAWIASGVGGGTVYCIKRLAASVAADPNDVPELDPWENIGHLTGSALAVVLVQVLPLSGPFVAAALFATSTATLAIAFSRVPASGVRPPPLSELTRISPRQ